MRVFVRVQVGDRNSRRLQLADLRRDFGFDLICIEPPCQCSQRKFTDAILKMLGVCATNETGNLVGRKHGRTIHQHHMTSDAQPRHRLRLANCVVESRTICHQRGGSHHTLLMRLDDGAIHATSQAKIVSINDQTPHARV